MKSNYQPVRLLQFRRYLLAKLLPPVLLHVGDLHGVQRRPEGLRGLRRPPIRHEAARLPVQQLVLQLLRVPEVDERRLDVVQALVQLSRLEEDGRAVAEAERGLPAVAAAIERRAQHGLAVLAESGRERLARVALVAAVAQSLAALGAVAVGHVARTLPA